MRHPRAYIHSPSVVFAARVNLIDPQEYPGSFLAYDTVTVGAYTDIQPGMTLLLGTTAGGDNLGRHYVEPGSDAISIKIGYFSRGVRDGELTVQDNAYITILYDRRIWAKLPFIDSAGEVFKATNIAVGDNGLYPPPVANAGSPMAGTAGAITGYLAVLLNGQGSFAVADGATIVSYLWDIADGTLAPAQSLTTDFTTVYFPPGFRYISLTVEDSNGKEHTTYLPIFVDDPADRTSFDKFLLEGHSVSEEGSKLSFRLLEDLPRATYPDGTLFLIWDREPTGTADRTHMLFVGWHQRDNASTRFELTGAIRDTTLQLVDVAGRMMTLPGFPQVINDEILRDEEEEPETTWQYMTLPNVDKFIHYLLYWHSTVLENIGFYPSGTWLDYPFIQLQVGGGNLFEQVSRLCRMIVPDYRLICDVRGSLKIIPDYMLLEVSERPTNIMVELQENEWSEVSFTYERSPRVHVLWGNATLTATEYVVVDDDEVITSVQSVAPGAIFGQGISENTWLEQLTRTQATLNQVTGHRYARLNSFYGPMTIKIPGETARDQIDYSIEGKVLLHISAELATQRGLPSTLLVGRPIGLSYSYGVTETGRTIDALLTIELETSGTPAYTWRPGEGAFQDDTDIPEAPTLLSATAISGGQIDLSWTDNAANEDGFKVERSPNGSTGWTQIGTTTAGDTTYSDTGLDFSTTYYYRVRAYNVGGDSDYSNVDDATTAAWVPPVDGDTGYFYNDMKGYVLWSNNAVLRTWDIQASSPTWERIDTGITGTLRDGQYVHTGPTTVGMWLLTSDGVWWCSDILATTPSWSHVLSLTTVQSEDATPSSSSVQFQAMFAYASEPGYLIVTTGPTGNVTDYQHAYFRHTHDYGANWTTVDMTAYTYSNLGQTSCYYQSGVNGLNIFRSAPGTIYSVRASGRVGVNGRTAVFISTDLGHTWTKGYEVLLNSNSVNDGLALLNPFPSATDPSYMTRGSSSAGTLPRLYKSTDEWANGAQITTPTGYDGINSLWRPNKRTFDNTHIIAWWHKTGGGYDLIESFDQGVTWGSPLLTQTGSQSYSVPNGWPPDDQQWVVVATGVTTLTLAVRLTLDNFGTMLDKKGNLSSVLPSGNWSTGLCNGFALPRVGVNA